LRVILGLIELPMETHIIEKHTVHGEQRKKNAKRNNRLLRTLTAHHFWLRGDSDGIRPDLRRGF